MLRQVWRRHRRLVPRSEELCAREVVARPQNVALHALEQGLEQLAGQVDKEKQLGELQQLFAYLGRPE